MALAPYYDRAALAAAQVVAGFDADAFARILDSTTVGLAVGSDAADAAEGTAAADLAVRLLARLYPRIEITAPEPVRAHLMSLAAAINPRIELRTDATVGICLGEAAGRFHRTIYAGTDCWIGRVGTHGPFSVGTSDNPFGSGVAACLAAANLFRVLFVPDGALEDDAAVSAYTGDKAGLDPDPALVAFRLPDDAVLVGLGAIGHGAAWAIARSPVTGRLALVDHQTVELSNVQRYVLADVTDVGRHKTGVIGDRLGSRLDVTRHVVPWAAFAAASRQQVGHVIVALDSARDRRAVQAALPRRVVNAWTQPGDLGVSSHGPFGGDGACLSCLYVADGPRPNEDETVAEALGVPERQQDVRLLLHSGAPVPGDLLDAIVGSLAVPDAAAAAFAGRSIRELYVEGLCGGALVPLERLGAPRQEVHVPLAHQSALAGVLLAAAFVRQLMAGQEPTRISRIDVLRPIGAGLSQPRLASPGCICRDPDYVDALTAKFAGQRRPQPHPLPL